MTGAYNFADALDNAANNLNLRLHGVKGYLATLQGPSETAWVNSVFGASIPSDGVWIAAHYSGDWEFPWVHAAGPENGLLIHDANWAAGEPSNEGCVILWNQANGNFWAAQDCASSSVNGGFLIEYECGAGLKFSGNACIGLFVIELFHLHFNLLLGYSTNFYS